MTPKLRITWDGIVPGLESRRLSLGAFTPALRELLAAVRRIATDLERDAWPTADVQYAGALSKEAGKIDLQIVALTANSPVTLEIDVVLIEPPERPLIADLGEKAVSRFLNDLREEARGAAAHYKVRQFLKKLPAGLHTQRYVHRNADGEVIREVDLGRVQIVESPVGPHLLEISGEIVGVGFEPGKLEVRMKGVSGDHLTLSASAEQVEEALALRGNQVVALAVTESTRTRLLRFNAAPPLPSAERIQFIFSHWRETMHRLAQ
jgi:hypothetical protein